MNNIKCAQKQMDIQTQTLEFCKTGVENQNKVFVAQATLVEHVFFNFRPHHVIFIQAKVFDPTRLIAIHWIMFGLSSVAKLDQMQSCGSSLIGFDLFD